MPKRTVFLTPLDCALLESLHPNTSDRFHRNTRRDVAEQNGLTLERVSQKLDFILFKLRCASDVNEESHLTEFSIEDELLLESEDEPPDG